MDLLKTCCFPNGCILPNESQKMLALVMVPKLEAAGMTPTEWTTGAVMLEEPHLSKVRSIVCQRCNLTACQFNFRSRIDGLGDLMCGLYADRLKKGDQLLGQLLPEARKTELGQEGIKCEASLLPSRKNPKLWFYFTRKGKTQKVYCEVGKRILSMNNGEEKLLSIEQLGQKIEKAINTLLTT